MCICFGLCDSPITESLASLPHLLLPPQTPKNTREGGGTLASFLSGLPGERMSEDEARVYFFQVLRGVMYCHRQRVVHRDIKPENILLAEDAEGKTTLKIADFGLSRTFDKHTKLKTSY